MNEQNNQDKKEIQRIITKAQKLIAKNKCKMTPYEKQCYIRDLIDIQNKILKENHKAVGKQQINLAFINTNINYILGARQWILKKRHQQ